MFSKFQRHNYKGKKEKKKKKDQLLCNRANKIRFDLLLSSPMNEPQCFHRIQRALCYRGWVLWEGVKLQGTPYCLGETPYFLIWSRKWRLNSFFSFFFWLFFFFLFSFDFLLTFDWNQNNQILLIVMSKQKQETQPASFGESYRPAYYTPGIFFPPFLYKVLFFSSKHTFLFFFKRNILCGQN